MRDETGKQLAETDHSGLTFALRALGSHGGTAGRGGRAWSHVCFRQSSLDAKWGEDRGLGGRRQGRLRGALSRTGGVWAEEGAGKEDCR